MQGLRAAERRSKRLNRRSHDVVLRLLSGQGRATGLGVKAKSHRLRIGGAETLAHDRCPETTRRAVLGDFFEQVVVSVEEETESGGEVIEYQSGVERGLHVRDAIGEGEGDLLHRGRAGFTDVIAGDRDGV